MAYLFNPYWWKYYQQADTLYQVHSPFLFDFGTHVWPHLPNELTDPSHDMVSANMNHRSWLSPFCTYYRTNQLMLLPDHRFDHLIDETCLSPVQVKNEKFNNFSWYHGLISKEICTPSPGKPTFPILAIVSAGQISSEMLTALSSSADSFMLICLNIHRKREDYQRWNQIIMSGEFHFSVELYNFGLLFYYPVNQQPEHITLIPWRWKPWKIKTL